MPVMTVGTGRALLDRNYIYALDGIPDVAVALSVRRLRSAYAGPCLRLRRVSDSAEKDFGFRDTGLNLDVVAIADWLGPTTGVVQTWYDQSGNGYDVSQETAVAQPSLSLAGLNGLPTLTLNSAQYLEALGNPVAAGGARTILAVGRIAGGATGGTLLTFRKTVRVFTAGAASASGILYIYSDGVDASRNATVNNAFLTTMQSAFVATYRSAGAEAFLEFRLNGADIAVAQTTGVSAENGNSEFRIGRREDAVVSNWIGDIAEVIVCASALSDATSQAIEVSQRSYYGLA